MTNIHTLHAHVETASSDCDGPFYTDYVMTPNDAEIAESEAANGVNDFSDIHFVERVAMAISHVYSCMWSGTLTVTAEDEGSFERTFEWSERTEEGHRSATARICTDEACDTDRRGQRDVYAEMMGY